MLDYSQRAGGFQTLHINYTQVGLCSYEVTGTEGMRPLEERLLAKRAETARMRRASREARGVLDQPRKRKASDRACGAVRRKKAKAPDDGSDVTGDREAEPAPSDRRSSGSEFGSFDEASEEADQGSDGPGEPPPPPLVLAPVPPPPLPPPVDDPPAPRYWESKSALGECKYWSGPPGAADRFYIGRISVQRPNTRSEAKGIYCSRHGCSILKTVRSCPTDDLIRQWLLDGLEIPKGKEHQARHKAMFPTL